MEQLEGPGGLEMTLTERRREKNLSLGELARKVNLGAAVVSRIERGQEDPPDAVVSDIATALDWTPNLVRAGLPGAAEAAELSERFAKTIEAMAACKTDAKAKGFKMGNGGRGKIDCPVCHGDLRYSVASVNGHMWGACSTEGCVRWME